MKWSQCKTLKNAVLPWPSQLWSKFYRVVHKTDPIGSFSLYNNCKTAEKQHRSVDPGRWSWVPFPVESAEHQIWNMWSKFRCILCLIGCCRLGQLFVSLHFSLQMLQKMSALSFKEFKHIWEHFHHVADVCRLTDWRLIGLKFVT